ncbi:hypothetical protein KC131_20825 [Pseudomonas sp. JQ170]|uniref:hypothetical protein n=1 Tax=unclassified Pseudomonas TaxID=196821 RepID=UPI0026507DB4|nr:MULTISPECIES: hypothetical protein [unclassified Pseudomonas]MDN7143099.1 hypothetical protein [Pseudomonas sp. JQ170]WRO74345.1 hypothetical protein U9R80_17690 [Pseudomonas sp. 170C]
MQIDLNNPEQFTLEAVRSMLAAGNNAQHNQLRVSRGGIAWLSQVVGGRELDGLAFRLETWAAGSGCVGEQGAADERWVLQVFNALKDNWPKPASDYIDLY